MSIGELSLNDEMNPWTVEEILGEVMYLQGRFTDLDDSRIERRTYYAHQVLGRARRALKSMNRITDGLRDDAELLTSELVTNALIHGGDLITLSIVHLNNPEEVHILVVNPTSDEGTPGVDRIGETVATEGNEVAEGGRGLLLVEDLSNGDWGQCNVRNHLATYAILRAGPPLADLDGESDATDRAA